MKCPNCFGRGDRYNGIKRTRVPCDTCKGAGEIPDRNPEKGPEPHTATPYNLYESASEGVFHIVKPWDEKTKVSQEPTFGSGLGAHIADVQFHTREGVATRERAKANAEFLVLAANTFDALAAASEAWEKWLIARAAGGRADTELMDAAIAQKRASNAMDDAKKGGA
jgi:hypothetical protein